MQEAEIQLENSIDSAKDIPIEDEENINGALATESRQERKTEFAPIPVEDWLLMIEKLVARKDLRRSCSPATKIQTSASKSQC